MKKTVLMIALAMTLAACDDKKPVAPPVPPAEALAYSAPATSALAAPTVAPAAAQPQVIVVQQPAAQSHDSGLGTALAAGAVGMMVGSALSNNNNSNNYAPAPQRTVVNKTVYNTTVVNKTVAAPTPVAPVAPVVKAEPLKSPAVVAPAKVFPEAKAAVAPSAPAKLSLAKPATTTSFGGFKKR